jgi:predicted nucleic acid-binding protein
VAGYGQRLLLDWSAYSRVLLAQTHPDSGRRLTRTQLDTLRAAAEAGELVVCAPFRIEARYSARSADSFRRLNEQLDVFGQARVDQRTWEIAEDAQRQLAETPGVSHRVKFADLVIAAAADQHSLGVLHYDADYDTIAEHTTLTYRSRWIAERGSLD